MSSENCEMLGGESSKAQNVGVPVRVEVEALAAGGRGLARVDGLVWMIQDALPGDVVDAVPLRFHARWVEARVHRRVEPSPLRRTAPCALQGRCAGCAWMPLADGAQLDWKRQIVADALERIGGFQRPAVDPTVPSPRTLGYRNKIELTLGRDPSGKPCLGFHGEEPSSGLVDVERCLVQEDAANRVLPEVRRALFENPSVPVEAWIVQSREPIRLVLRTSSATGRVLVGIRSVGAPLPGVERFASMLARSSGEVASVVQLIAQPGRRGGVRALPLWGDPLSDERIAGLHFRLPASSFLQVNHGASERMLALTAELSDAGLRPRVLELYGGMGLFSLVLARRGASSLVCEADPLAVECGQAAARENGNLPVRFHRGDAGNFVERLRRSGGKAPDVVLADPPRQGMGTGVAKGIASLRARKILIVSCDPATLARDARAIREGGYFLKRVVPIDLFPQTPHVEALAVLERASPV